MTEQNQFRQLLAELNITQKELALELGLSADSVKSLLVPSRKLPTWAKSMLFTKWLIQNPTLENKTMLNSSESAGCENPNQTAMFLP